ncbi:hypothetical protein RI367_007786 [Sorochytrium milnesiophthora]
MRYTIPAAVRSYLPETRSDTLEAASVAAIGSRYPIPGGGFVSQPSQTDIFAAERAKGSTLTAPLATVDKELQGYQNSADLELRTIVPAMHYSQQLRRVYDFDGFEADHPDAEQPTEEELEPWQDAEGNLAVTDALRATLGNLEQTLAHTLTVNRHAYGQLECKRRRNLAESAGCSKTVTEQLSHLPSIDHWRLLGSEVEQADQHVRDGQQQDAVIRLAAGNGREGSTPRPSFRPNTARTEHSVNYPRFERQFRPSYQQHGRGRGRGGWRGNTSSSSNHSSGNYSGSNQGNTYSRPPGYTGGNPTNNEQRH